MSWWEYKASLELSKHDPDFYGLIMAAARKADTMNLYALTEAFPETIKELRARYNAPGGVLDSDPQSLKDKVFGIKTEIDVVDTGQ